MGCSELCNIHVYIYIHTVVLKVLLKKESLNSEVIIRIDTKLKLSVYLTVVERYNGLGFTLRHCDKHGIELTNIDLLLLFAGQRLMSYFII